jgi:hypothetical protein
MSDENDLTCEDSAFPIVCFNTQGMPNVLAHGMTLRDWFAGQVLAGYSALPDERSHRACDGNAAAWRANLRKQDAEYCYQMADAMLKVRKQ